MDDKPKCMHSCMHVLASDIRLQGMGKLCLNLQPSNCWLILFQIILIFGLYCQAVDIFALFALKVSAFTNFNQNT